MQSAVSAAREARARHRHRLRALTYVTLDQTNIGIVRDLTHEGVAVQAAAEVRPHQELRLHFELRNPRLRVEIRGEVVWIGHSGQFGIRFIDTSPRITRQINEWIFGNLLEGFAPRSSRVGSTIGESMFAQSMFADATVEEVRAATLSPEIAAGVQAVAEVQDGLIVSATPVKVIELPVIPEALEPAAEKAEIVENLPHAPVELDWLSQPLSGRSLAWTVNTLVVVAAVLLVTLVFLAVTRELPKWPITMTLGAAVFVAGLYWGFTRFLGGATLGVRLARLAGAESEEETEARFR